MFQNRPESLEYFISSRDNTTSEECEKCMLKKSEEEQNQNRFSYLKSNWTFDNYLKNKSMNFKKNRGHTYNHYKIISVYSLQI